ncbi:hypothetical protein [Pseudonocardia sp. ICBG1142]|uniref:hypothetical protein n=1 Tax=Pseudonocardia sp. ICBG1142 TaxID=2846760 RepID=UPI001CF6203B|nr:hypothetical protein [Pseudonocardia sp. ICBG1142]
MATERAIPVQVLSEIACMRVFACLGVLSWGVGVLSFPCELGRGRRGGLCGADGGSGDDAVGGAGRVGALGCWHLVRGALLFLLVRNAVRVLYLGGYGGVGSAGGDVLGLGGVLGGEEGVDVVVVGCGAGAAGRPEHFALEDVGRVELVNVERCRRHLLPVRGLFLGCGGVGVLPVGGGVSSGGVSGGGVVSPAEGDAAVEDREPFPS